MIYPRHAAAPGAVSVEGEAGNKAGGPTPTILGDLVAGAEFPPSLSAAQAALTVDDKHALVVVSTTGTAHVRRRVLFSLPSAQAAVDRAHARGQTAQIVLVRLASVGVVDHG